MCLSPGTPQRTIGEDDRYDLSRTSNVGGGRPWPTPLHYRNSVCRRQSASGFLIGLRSVAELVVDDHSNRSIASDVGCCAKRVLDEEECKHKPHGLFTKTEHPHQHGPRCHDRASRNPNGPHCNDHYDQRHHRFADRRRRRPESAAAHVFHLAASCR